MIGNKEKHPSYGTLLFNRRNGGTRALFGSSIKHKDTISMYLYEAELSRSLNSDHIYGNKRIVEVEMSYSQFAEAITSMNMGSGVPVTIQYVRDVGNIEPCPFIDKREQFENEFKDDIKKQNELANKLITEAENLFNEKKSFTKSDKENILSLLRTLKQEIGCNTEFTYEMFNEQMDKTTMEAKGKIEAFMQNKVNTIATAALVEHKDDFTKLDNPVDL